VRMSLVSGKPISFISQLYPPRYVQRQTADLPELAALAPVVYGGAIGGVAGGAPAGVMGGIVGGLPSAASPPPPQSPAPMAKSIRQFEAPRANMAAETSNFGSTATGREAADLFEYSIPSAVTVKKNESAMLPFLQQKVGSRKLLIYSDRNSQHPLNAAELTNSTHMTLDGGPITVYDGGVYAGEALMETIKDGDKRLISYGVDLGTRITTAFDSSTFTVRELHAAHGVMTAKMSRVDSTTYTARNVDAKAKTLIIEQPAMAEFTVVSPKPVETTATAWRFQMELPATGAAKTSIVLENVYDQRTELNAITPADIITWVQNKALNTAGRRQLEQLSDLKKQLAGVIAETGSNDAEVTSITRDEERARQNIGSLRNVSEQQEQVQNYARQLAEYEVRISGLHDRRGELEKQRTGLQGQINDLVEKISF